MDQFRFLIEDVRAFEILVEWVKKHYSYLIKDFYLKTLELTIIFTFDNKYARNIDDAQFMQKITHRTFKWQ